MPEPADEPPFNSRFGPGTDRTLGDEVQYRFAQWLRTPFGTLDERWAMNLLLNSLYRIDPDSFATVAAEHGMERTPDDA